MNRRAYRSPLRQEQSRLTRARVLDAARTLLLQQGYGATTMAAVARAAEVSPQTVYAAFVSKPALVKAVWDVTLVGDDDPVPFAERPAVRALMAETDARAYLRGYAAVGAVLLDRLGPLLSVLLAGARSGDDDLASLVATVDGERLVGTLMTARRVDELGALRSDLTVERARDAIWTLNSAQVHELLVRQRGWSTQQYVAFTGDAMVAAVVDPGWSPA